MRKNIVAGFIGAVVAAGVLVPLTSLRIRAERERAEVLERRAAAAELRAEDRAKDAHTADGELKGEPKAVREFESERAILRAGMGQPVWEGALEVAILLAVDKGVRPEQLRDWISVPPSVGTGSGWGKIALKSFAADRAMIVALRDSPRYALWTLVRGEDRPAIGIYWDKMNTPRVFMGWWTDPK